MINGLKIFTFTVAVVLFYTYVGMMVPQKETHPPEDLEIRADMTTDEMVEIGQKIVGGKGTCLTCHTIGSNKAERFPDLAGIGSVAETRKEGLDAVEYLAESLYEPNIYVVKGFLPGMPPIGNPPISLSDEEILTVIAYLQSLGSTPTVDMQTRLKYAGQAVAAAPVAAPEGSGEALFVKYLCHTCHKVDVPDRLVGPSLYDAGTRLDKAALFESILDPDATITKGFPPGVMLATLKAVGFYDKATLAEVGDLVDFVAARKGHK